MQEISDEMRRRIEFLDWLSERSPIQPDELMRESLVKRFLEGKCLKMTRSTQGMAISNVKPKKKTSSGDKTHPF